MEQTLRDIIPGIRIKRNVVGKGTILEYIGGTPLVRIRNILNHKKCVEVYAKMESFNPGGSVKDRPALWMIDDGIKTGTLTKEKTILEATSGNTGIAMALIGATLGYKVELCVPKNVSEERKKILNAYGTKITLTDPLEGSDGAIKEAIKKYQDNADKYFRPDQYNNPMNVNAHYETTGVEIIEQTGGKVTHVVAGIGTSGTIMGIRKRLKEYNKKIQIIAVEPDCPLHGLEGLKHMSTSIVPGIYDESLIDRKINVSTEAAYRMVKQLTKEEGLFVGQSSGAAIVAAEQVANEIQEGLIVVIFPDGGDKYLSTNLWD
ncbi:MAG TPA: cysteine synthase family protein [bacterium]